MHLISPHFMYLIFYHLYHKIGKVFIYKLKKYFAIVSICILAICQEIRLLSLSVTKW